MNRKAERGQATREHVLEVATRLFAERGYEDSSIEVVLQQTGISRGALYYHYRSKEALFEAVVESVEQEVGRRVLAEAAGAPDPVAALRIACLAWVRLAGDPVVRRVLLVDAPSVLGWQRWRELDERHTLGQLKATMRAVSGMGRLEPELVDVMAHVWMAAMSEIAFYIARSRDEAAAMREAEATVDRLLARLLGG